MKFRVQGLQKGDELGPVPQDPPPPHTWIRLIEPATQGSSGLRMFSREIIGFNKRFNQKVIKKRIFQSRLRFSNNHGLESGMFELGSRTRGGSRNFQQHKNVNFGQRKVGGGGGRRGCPESTPAHIPKE